MIMDTESHLIYLGDEKTAINSAIFRVLQRALKIEFEKQ